MVIVLLGASGSGKSIIESELSRHHGFSKIISYTTREPRINEENGKDYYFTNNDTFKEMLNNELFAEYDTYSQNRMYGTLKSDYTSSGNKVVVLTPNGFRKLKETCKDNIFSVFVNSSLATRMKRYIDRCGDGFSFDDKNEICSRVERDFGMFLGIDREVDFIVNNNEGTDINDVVEEIINKFGEIQCVEE